MKLTFALIPSLLLAASVAVSASPAEAQRVRKTWDLRQETWELELRAAATPEAKANVLAARPDATQAARDMWKAIGAALGEEWTIEHAAWFLRATPGLLTTNPDGGTKPAFADEIDAVRKAVETRLLKSPKLAPMCMALVTNQDPRSLAILEKVIAENPDEKVQGVASLAAAMVLKSLGDDAEVMKKRITNLRAAIIKSADVDLGGAKVADLARDEIYIITYLTKGRIAPDLGGTDSGGAPLRLSDHKGKVICLLFWKSDMLEARRVAAITTETATRFQGRPFVVIGVNQDKPEVLRSLESDGTVTWRSLSDSTGELSKTYRIASLPTVYILDGERKIHYSGNPGTFAELTAEALLSGTPSRSETMPVGETDK
jgi:peroxiredoxin